MVTGARQWGTPFTADTWFNFAYEINVRPTPFKTCVSATANNNIEQFSANTVGLWASTGASPLTKVVNNVSASTSTNSADFHVGVLRIVQGNPPEDWYISGVYVESGDITTAIGTGNSTGGGTTSAPASTTQGQASTTAVASTTTSAAGATQTQWGQCGGRDPLCIFSVVTALNALI